MQVKKTAANVAAILLVAGGFFWILSLFCAPGGRTFTDNAQVRQDIVPVHARVQGYVREVRYADFQQVHHGDTLIVIDDSELRLALAQAEAAYQSALVGKEAHGTAIRATRNNAAVNDSQQEELRVRLANLEKQLERCRKLLASGNIRQQDYDDTEAAYKAMKAQYEALGRQQQSTLLTADEQTLRLGQNQASIATAEALVELARLNLSYTVITAPCDGYVSRRDLNPGQLVHPGQQLLSVVDDSQRWCIANFRERQMRHISVGTPVRITVDALKGQCFEGKVESIAPASGEQYAAVPQDNAVGNFVKVEQRVPVRIAFCEGQELDALKAGMNVEIKVK